MNARPSPHLIAATLVALAWATLVVAQSPEYPKTLAYSNGWGYVNSPPVGYHALGIASEPDGEWKRPFVCYGLHQFNNKPRYLYFIVVKTDRTRKWDMSTATGLGDPDDLKVKGYQDLNKAHQGTVEKMFVRFSDGKIAKKLEIGYKFEADEKTGALASESLRINGKEYKINGPRVFLWDLTLVKPTCTPLKVALPASVPKVKDRGGEATSKALIKALKQLAEKSPEVKEIFEGAARK
jgi:hypothetical protein